MGQHPDSPGITVAPSPSHKMAVDPTRAEPPKVLMESGRIVAALCHGVSALLNVRLPGGQWLVAGKTLTGFANVEEDYGDAAAGVRIMPWRLEDALRERGANYIQAGLFKPFAIHDGRLATGQQQYSGRAVARLVIEMLAP
jgi:putative intracellular protease/amidase